MESQKETTSDITKFYTGKRIFLTGATGFLGKMIMEKLLRTCKDIDKIYIMVRPKKGIEIEQRMEEIFEGICMGPMKDQNLTYQNKVSLMSGDLLLPKCGLSEENIQILINDVHIIIHCAATVRFDQIIKNATYVNVRATKDLMDIAREMKQLKAFLYVSTAYSFCPRHDIGEILYPPPISPKALMALVDVLNNEELSGITPKLLGKWPNTYVYTKAVAEGLIAEEGKGLPMVVVRPSIVIASVKEPLPGWIDNLYGPSSVILAAGLGFLRCFQGNRDNYADMVPADYVVNTILAASYDKATQRDENLQSDSQIENVTVYNYCCTPIAPLKWNRCLNMIRQVGIAKYATPQALWYPILNIRKNAVLHHTAFFFQQTIPAYIIDGILFMIGRKMQALDMLAKLKQLTEVLGYFSLRQWDFKIDNTVGLWNRLGPNDQKLFHFSMRNFNWDEYNDSYVRGIRIYLLKEPIETIPEGQRKMKMLYGVHLLFSSLLYLLLLSVLYFIFRLFI